MKISIIDKSEKWELVDIIVHDGKIHYVLGPERTDYDPASKADYMAQIEEDNYRDRHE